MTVVAAKCPKCRYGWAYRKIGKRYAHFMCDRCKFLWQEARLDVATSNQDTKPN